MKLLNTDSISVFTEHKCKQWHNYVLFWCPQSAITARIETNILIIYGEFSYLVQTSSHMTWDKIWKLKFYQLNGCKSCYITKSHGRSYLFLTGRTTRLMILSHYTADWGHNLVNLNLLKEHSRDATKTSNVITIWRAVAKSWNIFEHSWRKSG